MCILSMSTSRERNILRINIQSRELALFFVGQSIRICLVDTKPLQPPQLDFGKLPYAFHRWYEPVEQRLIRLRLFVEVTSVNLRSQ